MSRNVDMDKEYSLIEQMKAGDMDAFDALYWQYQKAVFNNILSLVKERETAEDLLQDVFISLWEKKDSIDTGRSLGGWLFVTSYNRAINFLKQKAREQKASAVISEVSMHIPVEESLEEMRIRELEKAIQILPSQKQKALYLCKIKGLSYIEASSALHISKNTVKEHISGAMQSIKARLLKIPGIGILFFFANITLK